MQSEKDRVGYSSPGPRAARFMPRKPVAHGCAEPRIARLRGDDGMRGRCIGARRRGRGWCKVRGLPVRSVWPGLSCDQPHRFGIRRGLFWVEAGEPVEPTVSLGAWRKACANRLGDRDPRGFKGFVVAVHASIVAQHASERHARICCESRDSRGTPLVQWH